VCGFHFDEDDDDKQPVFWQLLISVSCILLALQKLLEKMVAGYDIKSVLCWQTCAPHI
jgi:hypothetical protein